MFVPCTAGAGRNAARYCSPKRPGLRGREAPYFVPTGTKRPRQGAPYHIGLTVVVHMCAIAYAMVRALALHRCAAASIAVIGIAAVIVGGDGFSGVGGGGLWFWFCGFRVGWIGV